MVTCVTVAVAPRTTTSGDVRARTTASADVRTRKVNVTQIRATVTIGTRRGHIFLFRGRDPSSIVLGPAYGVFTLPDSYADSYSDSDSDNMQKGYTGTNCDAKLLCKLLKKPPYQY